METRGDLTIVARASHQRHCAEAIASGVRRHGGTVRIQEATQCSTHHVACWGWRKGAELRKAGHEVLVMERGYLGDRFAWYSLGWNGLNGNATFKMPPDVGPGRFREHHGTLRPWASVDGDYVLIVGQVPGDASLRGLDLLPWYGERAREAHHKYGKPVLFREHPEARKRGFDRRPAYTESAPCEPLEQALRKAHLVVTYNSNTGVDAIIAGVPCVAWDAGSMVYGLVPKNVGMRVMPDRTAWAERLAWTQWTLTEIARGSPFHASHFQR